mgnify:CR=1 FL=1
MMKISKTFTDYALNMPGWRTNREIVVIESDDWGMVRMASRAARARLQSKGHHIKKSIYNTFDAIACNKDIEHLAEVLDSVKDSQGRPAKFTLNTVMANPDFERIEAENYHQYFYEPFPQTLSSYPDSDSVLSLLQQGIKNGVFQPQFHGREHVQINNWLKQLQSRNKTFMDAFQERMFTLKPPQGFACRAECLDAMATYQIEDFTIVKDSIREGLTLFEKIWGFPSQSLIAPCYTWHRNLEPQMASLGIRYLQGARAQREPQIRQEKKKIRRHFMGQQSTYGIRYLIRNVHFEQARNSHKDWIDAALNEIRVAFRMRKPAIISSHRVNYIGRLDPDNRNKNLRFLKELLDSIVKYYPSVEFMSTDELGDLMTKS